jgi:acetylornithine deacetylase/succinyl-diaminopimelate desuccinylase-like protein
MTLHAWRGTLTATALLALATASAAAPSAHSQTTSQTLDLAKQAIALRSVRGPGNQTPKVAALFRSALIAGGIPAADVTITPVDDTAFLIARWRGTDPALKPVVVSGHMDVVEAKPADWQRDPFKAVVENGYLFGRGASDMKLDASIAIQSVIALKRSGFRPRRDIVLAFSGDEETTMKTSQIIAGRLAGAEMVINVDGGNGRLDDRTGQPMFLSWGAAEKTYADFQLTVTNEGGHSSEPRPDNAINQLAAALVRIGAYQFKPELNEITRSYFNEAARYQDAKTAAAMRRFAANPDDAGALAALRGNPDMVGKVGTTCVATMINGGHALNALPQRATANINCRIFPGHKPAAIMAELQRVAAEPSVTFKDVTVGAVATEASPMLPRFTAAIAKAIAHARPGVGVFPTVDQGASDNMWFRAKGVPSYSASGVFYKESEDFSHGLNERIPVASIAPAIDYTMVLLSELAK